MPPEFWVEAANYAAYVRNRVPKTGTMLIPQELWTGRPCEHTQLRPFGSTVYVRDHTGPNKLAPRYLKAILVGYRSYSESTVRYYNPSTKQFNYSRDFVFERPSTLGAVVQPPVVESEARVPTFDWKGRNLQLSLLPRPEDTQSVIVSPTEQPTPPVKLASPPDAPKGVKVIDGIEPYERDEPDTPTKHSAYTPRNFLSGWQAPATKAAPVSSTTTEINDTAVPVAVPLPTIVEEDEESAQVEALIAAGLTTNSATSALAYAPMASDCPNTYRQARLSKDAAHWRVAMDDELAKMKKYDVWEEVPRTDQMRVLRARWVYTRKINGDTGREEAYKARWVVRGFEQVHGLDHHEVYASVAHKDSIRVFLSIVNYHKMFCDQVDIKAAFLNGDLEETIYLEPAEGSDTPPTHVYKLRKSLYGLKQSPRCFNQKLDKWLRGQGFVPNVADSCLYSYRNGDTFLMLTVHVDDQLIAGNDRSAIDAFKRKLNDEFECTDHGAVSYFLGFNVMRDVENRKLWISQEHYLESVLAKFDMTNAGTQKTPLPATFKAVPATDEEHEQVKHLPYRAIVGSIMYAATISRPDLAFPANLLARYLSKWSAAHMSAAKHLLRYIRGTSDLCLLYDAESSTRIIQGHCDADWGSCVDTRRSTTGYTFGTFGGLASWKSRRQSTVALSTMEAELMAGCDAVKQAAWLRLLLGDLQMLGKEPITIFNDNQSTIAAASNPGQHDRSKHIGIRGNYVRDNVKDGQVRFEYVSTEDNQADLLTKALSKDKTDRFCQSMGLERHHIETRDISPDRSKSN